MTIGLLLIFVGIQLYMIETYVLTSAATEFLNDRDGTGQEQPTESIAQQQQSYRSPFFQTSYPNDSGNSSIPGNSKTISPPRWLCWPIGFLGCVLALHGLAMRKS